MADLSKGTKGGIAELKAAAWLSERGYEVFRNVTQDGPADLVAWDTKSGETLFVDVKMARVNVIPAGYVLRRKNRPNDFVYRSDSYFLSFNRLSDKQKALGVRLLLVLDDFIGWDGEHPMQMLDGLVQSHYANKKAAKSSDNSTILLDQEQGVVS
jgi:Holliday junction resolvase-like predicted endonuclease